MDYEQGKIVKGTIPDYILIERAAHEVGQRVARIAQQIHMDRLASEQPARVKCPGCGNVCWMTRHKREVASSDGEVLLQEQKCHCPGCRRGEVDQVLEELSAWQEQWGLPPEAAKSTDSCEIIATALRYLTNNRDRMQNDAYRRAGLPITTAWMESLVREVNYRVKGTEMYWNQPDRAEAILQVRAAALCDDARLVQHLETRPGFPSTRKPKTANSRQEKTKR